MGRPRISVFLLASIFLILFFLLIIFYFNELNPIVDTTEGAEDATIRDLNEHIGKYIGKKVRITGTISSPEGDYMVIVNESEEFIVTNPQLNLKQGREYEIEGFVRSRPAFYYRYYRVEYYIDVKSVREI